ncbi:MAG TPA: hypothetical protein VFS40_00400 [Gemmatimonadales bacterium]|nr:hypothetical protein [Gemmatimonadales bacterium]
MSGTRPAAARPRVLLSWSSGKDSAWALHRLRATGEVEVGGLVTTVNAAAGRVAMHAVRETLLRAQAAAAELPLVTVPIPSPCSNEEYERAFGAALAQAGAQGVTAVAFGDLFLEDVRAYRERQVRAAGLAPLFPLWGEDTAALARTMLAAGLAARLTCIDPRVLSRESAGRAFDAALLAALPAGVDPCGERGEFHTFCHAGPMFAREIPVTVGEVVERDGFVFADLLGGGGGG